MVYEAQVYYTNRMNFERPLFVDDKNMVQKP
mgnify:CR=1 FL=1